MLDPIKLTVQKVVIQRITMNSESAVMLAVLKSIYRRIGYTTKFMNVW